MSEPCCGGGGTRRVCPLQRIGEAEAMAGAVVGVGSRDSMWKNITTFTDKKKKGASPGFAFSRVTTPLPPQTAGSMNT